MSTPTLDELSSDTEQLRSAGHPSADWFRDQLEILERLDALIGRSVRDAEPLDRLEAAVRPRERAALHANLVAELKRADAELQRSGDDAPRLNVRDFGALGDNMHNDGPAFRAAFAAIAALDSATLHVPAGRYRIDGFGGTPMRTHLLLSGLSNVTIRGDGMYESVLVASEIGAHLRMENCSGVKLADIGFDFDPLPFTQGVLESLDEEGFAIVWRLQPGWTSPLDFPFNLTGDPAEHADFMEAKAHSRESGRVLHHSGFSVKRVEALGDGRFRLYGAKKAWESGRDFPSAFEAGRPVVLSSRNSPGWQPAIWTASTRYCTFDRVGVFASWGHTFQLVGDTALKMTDCVCEPLPGTDRLAVSNADGLHVVSQRIGPYIRGCRILRNNDDSSNFYCKAVSIDDHPAPRTLVLDAAYSPDDRATNWQPDNRAFAVGDQLALLDPMTGEVVATPVIAAKRETSWRGFRRVLVELDQDLPPLRSRESLGKRHAVFSNMEFYMSEPEERIEHMVANLQTKCDGFVLRDSRFGENSVNGIKLKASNGIVSGNHFDRHAGIGITILMRLTWQEAFPSRNVRIEKNRFTGCNGIRAVIGYPGGREPFGPPYISDIELDSNTIEEPVEFGMRLDNMRDSTISQTTINGKPVDPSVVRETCRRVRVDNELRG